MSLIRGFEDLPKEEKITHKEAVARKIPWSTEVLDKMEKRSAIPSPLFVWWEQEKKKQTKGLENEIDLNEIKAALNKTINKWTDAVNLNRDFFIVVNENKKIDWEKALSLLGDKGSM